MLEKDVDYRYTNLTTRDQAWSISCLFRVVKLFSQPFFNCLAVNSTKMAPWRLSVTLRPITMHRTIGLTG